MAKTAAFHGRISAGIDYKLKIVIHVITEWAPQGFQGEARRYVAPWVLSPPRRQTGNQTPSVRSLLPKVKYLFALVDY